MTPRLPIAYYLENPSRNNFNLIRLFAALAVIFGHSFALSLNQGGQVEPVLYYLKFTYSGSIAVDVFFLISGIFISQSLFAEHNFSLFLTKRFLRIWPGLVVCLVVTVMLIATILPAIRTELLLSPATYSYVLNNSVLNIQWGLPHVFEGRHYYAINGSLWTLPLEVKMYGTVLICGIFGLLFRKIALVTFSIAAIVFVATMPSQFQGLFNAQDKESVVPVLFFLSGMAVFALRTVVSVRWSHIVCLLALAAFAGPPTFEIICYILIGLTTIWVGCSPLLSRLPKPRGDYSYGVYIYGFPIQQIVATIWPGAEPYEMFATSTLAVVPCAMMSWHFVELPAQVVGKSVARLFSVGVPTSEAVRSMIGRSWLKLSLPVLATAVAVAGVSMTELQAEVSQPESLDKEIVAFGPTPIVHGQPFNQQPSGESAIWVKLSGSADNDFTLVLGGESLTTVVSGDLLTAAVPPKLVAAVGSLPLFAEAVRQGHKMRSRPVAFDVH